MSKPRWKSDNRFFFTNLWKRDLRSHCKPLTRHESIALVRLLQDPQSTPEAAQHARDALILSCLPLAHSLASNAYSLGVEEAIAVANLAVVKAVDNGIKTFDVDNPGAGLFSYVSRAVQFELLAAQRDAMNLVKVPQTRLNQKNRLRKARLALGDDLSTEEIAEASGLPVNVVLRADAVEPKRVISFNEPIADSKQKDQETITYEEAVPDVKALSPEEIIATEEGREYLRLLLLRQLSDNQYQILVRSLGLLNPEPMSYAEIALDLNSTVLRCKSNAQQAYRRLRKLPWLREFLKLLATPHRLFGKAPITALAREDARPRSQRGSGHTAKLTPDNVREIRAALKAGAKGKDLAKQYGVAQSQISCVKRGRTWKDVT